MRTPVAAVGATVDRTAEVPELAALIEREPFLATAWNELQQQGGIRYETARSSA